MNYFAIPGLSDQLTMLGIQTTIRNRLGISATEFESKSRNSEIVEARQLTAYFARTTLGLTFHTIGREMGQNHSTIVASVKRINDLLDVDGRVQGLVSDLKEKFTQLTHKN